MSDEPLPLDELLRPLTGRRVLLADDVDAVRRLYERALLRAGAEVTAVADGLAAVSAWRRDHAAGGRFDVVVLDHEMPALTGAEAALTLHLAGFGGRIVGFTATLDAAEDAAWRAAGCRIVLPKSLPLPAFVERIAAAAEG